MAMGIWLKETLREKGMTIKQLSELSGVSLNTLYSITKRDTERIDPVILRQIKKAIGLDKTELEPCPFCGTEAEFCSDGSDNSNGVTIQKWIPVWERLPDSFDQYLCVVMRPIPGGEYVREVSVLWCDHDKKWSCEGLIVTHWMPLPVPPKEET